VGGLIRRGLGLGLRLPDLGVGLVFGGGGWFFGGWGCRRGAGSSVVGFSVGGLIRWVG
jgi:hypothetical protein